MTVSQVEATDSQKKEKEEVPQYINDDQVMGTLLASQVPLQEGELKVSLTASPWGGETKNKNKNKLELF